MIPRDSSALAIDPGYSKYGDGNACALGIHGKLSRVWYEGSDDWRPSNAARGELAHVIIEQPQQDGRSWAVPPAVLIRLAWEGASLAGLYAGASGAKLQCPSVSAWKGSEAKPAMHRRLWKALEPSERVVLGGERVGAAILKACEAGALCRWKKAGADLYPSSFKTHNLLDAAALLLWALGRLEKKG